MLYITATIYSALTYMETFLGTCIDSGASRFAVQIAQTKLHAHTTTTPFSLSPSPQKFVFAINLNRLRGTLPVSVPLLDGSDLRFYLDVVDASVPFLLKLDVREDHYFILDMKRRNLQFHEKK